MDDPTPKKRRKTTATPRAKAGRGVTPIPDNANPIPSSTSAVAPASISTGQNDIVTAKGEATGVAEGEGEKGQKKDAGAEEEEEEEDSFEEFTFTRSLVNKVAERGIFFFSALFATFTPEEQARYEVFRRAKIQKGSMRKHISTLCGHTIPESSATVVAGVAKLFVGEMTERAREVMEDWNDTGAIRPDHIREAYRRYKRDPAALGPKGVAGRLF
ncbi:histone-fold-containing protein [Fimicolochytrium jonesii]|uniref:histone-fold-containing protein n=1 Tax=Fimicolochytrium jonesii TaxID=1396493 RepID=UPI0022FED24A|nr:histone-fold-containing protein [Fimicolochytrium jonesii]KAI8818195.1 histone-fold-containing protein [Fimicolochytrium jonesii]